jgi:nitroimidazol reductase NimA-like FMN-containing flavoprotein (pyridoxamine 5'-phosphate oxidase superfamily)
VAGLQSLVDCKTIILGNEDSEDGSGYQGGQVDSAARVIDERLQSYLDASIFVRVATVTPGGRPHVAPYWFATDGDRIVISTLANQTVRNLRANADAAVLVDLGTDFRELRGSLIRGTSREYAPGADVPTEVQALLDEIERVHAPELVGPEFERYERFETRDHVTIEITPTSATWFDLGASEMGRTGRDADRPIGPLPAST